MLLCFNLAATAAKAPPEDAAIVRHLNAAITWYRELATANVLPVSRATHSISDNARNLAKQALQLAFESGEAEAAFLTSPKEGESPEDHPPVSPASSNQTSGGQIRH